MERAIDRLIAALDEIDGDGDLEPVLGAPEAHPMTPRTGYRKRHGDQRRWSAGGDIGEREAVSEDEGAQCEDEGSETGDDEYSLGWTLADGEGCRPVSPPSDDREPSLGSLGSCGVLTSQTGWAGGGSEAGMHRDFDGEYQCEDEGGQDDREPADHSPVALTFAKLPDGTDDQTRPTLAW